MREGEAALEQPVSHKEGQLAVSWRSYLEEEPNAHEQRKNEKNRIAGVENSGRYMHCLLCSLFSLYFPQTGGIWPPPADIAPLWDFHIQYLYLQSEIKLDWYPNSWIFTFSKPPNLRPSNGGDNIYPLVVGRMIAVTERFPQMRIGGSGRRTAARYLEIWSYLQVHCVIRGVWVPALVTCLGPQIAVPFHIAPPCVS